MPHLRFETTTPRDKSAFTERVAERFGETPVLTPDSPAQSSAQ